MYMSCFGNTCRVFHISFTDEAQGRILLDVFIVNMSAKTFSGWFDCSMHALILCVGDHSPS